MTLPLLIVNPRSSGGRTGRAFPAMRRTIEAGLGACDVALTERVGHAIDIAQGAVADRRPLVVAVGGDGTLNEVVSGLMAARPLGETALGVVAQGTGGDFRRSLGLEHRLDRYVAAIASGRTRRIDVGKIRYRDRHGELATRHFVNIVSAGMSGLVDRYVESASRAAGGTAAYFAASVRALTTFVPGRIRCRATLGGKTEERVLEGPLVVAVCNGRYFGSGMKVAPMAELDDGRFEVVAMAPPPSVGRGALGKLAFVLGSHRVYAGAHVGAPGTTHFACDRIEITAADGAEYPLDVDGEALGGLPLDVEVLPRALTVRA